MWPKEGIFDASEDCFIIQASDSKILNSNPDQDIPNPQDIKKIIRIGQIRGV